MLGSLFPGAKSAGRDRKVFTVTLADGEFMVRLENPDTQSECLRMLWQEGPMGITSWVFSFTEKKMKPEKGSGIFKLSQ